MSIASAWESSKSASSELIVAIPEIECRRMIGMNFCSMSSTTWLNSSAE